MNNFEIIKAKIQDWQTIAQTAQIWKANGKKIVFSKYECSKKARTDC